MATSRLALDEALDLFLTAMLAEGASQNTVTTYRETVGRFIQFVREQGCESVQDVDTATLRLWMIRCREQGLSPHSLYNYFRHPRRWFNWLLQEGLIQETLFSRMKAPRVPQGVKRALSEQEIRQLRNACNGKHWMNLRDKALILLLLSTGLRAAEAHQLRVGDTDKDALLIRGKGNKQRVVPLLPQVRLALKRYVTACPYIRPHEKDARLCWGSHAVPLTCDGLKQCVRDTARRAGLTTFGPHTLRRTCATRLLQDGASVEHVRLLLGHSDYSVLRHYLNLTESDLRQTIQQHNPLKNIKETGR